jgi:RHS repeat-associated protein
MTDENTTRHFEWDHSDRMKVFRDQTNAAGAEGEGELAEPTVYAHYLYDSAGVRTKKLVRKQGGRVEVTEYIDGVFEFQRIAGVANNLVHIMDDHARIATVRVGDALQSDTLPPLTYQLGDHLGNSNIVVSDKGDFINREEYFPYGETSFGSFAMKRYRFSGKERDEESGLYYHAARYFATWLCRWVTGDPIGLRAGPNPYQYCAANPLTFRDRSGLQKEPSTGVDTRPFKINIDEIDPVAQGGSVDNPANKEFKEDVTNVRHKNAFPESTTRLEPPRSMVSLADAKKEGSYAFREASTRMFAKSFDQTKELKEITEYVAEHVAKKYRTMTPRDTANTVNRLIRDIIRGRRKTPERIAAQVSLVREAFAEAKISHRTWELSRTGVKVGKLPAGSIPISARLGRLATSTFGAVGTGIGVAMPFVGGSLTIAASMTSDEPVLAIGGAVLGTAEVTGGVITTGGVVLGSAESVAIGGIMSTISTSLTLLIVGGAIQMPLDADRATRQLRFQQEGNYFGAFMEYVGGLNHYYSF